MTNESESQVVARIYVRLSDWSRTSIPRQIEQAEEYAEEREWIVDHVYNEGQGSSGWDENREEYQTMLADAKAGEFHVLIVRSMERIGRDKLERIRALIDLHSWGVQVHTIERGHVDLEDEGDFVVEAVKASSDDHGKRGESKRLAQEMRRRKENGLYIGEEPAGLAYDDNKEYLTKGSDFEGAIRVIKLRDEGLTYAEIAEQVRWSAPTVGKILKRREEYHHVRDGGKLGFKLSKVEPAVATDGGSE